MSNDNVACKTGNKSRIPIGDPGESAVLALNANRAGSPVRRDVPSLCLHGQFEIEPVGFCVAGLHRSAAKWLREAEPRQQCVPRRSLGTRKGLLRFFEKRGQQDALPVNGGDDSAVVDRAAEFLRKVLWPHE